jgi:hypothetical protein
MLFFHTNSQRVPKTLTVNKLLEPSNRWLGMLPLAFFLAQVVHYWRINELGHLMWMCNIGNLLFAVGLFLRLRRLMLIAIIWTIPGLFIWLLYVVLAWGVFFSSTLAHIGGLAVGMLVLRKIGMDRRTWLYAFGWYLGLQLLSRLFTPPNLNVNLAHAIQPGWDHLFRTYWQFWLVLTSVVGLTLWGLEILFRKVWPARTAQIWSGI